MTPSQLLALTLGDPAGCGPAITQAAWKHFSMGDDAVFYLRGAPELYRDVPVEIIATPQQAHSVFPRALPVIPLENEAGGVTVGRPDVASAAATIESIRLCVQDVRDGPTGAIVTNPIAKSLLAASGFAHPGHTEFLAELCRTKDRTPQAVMMLVGGGLRVALATIHLPLRDAINAITTDRLIQVARIVDDAMRTRFSIASPRLVFTGLNPHAGEDGLLGREEIDIINPTAEHLRSEGINLADARPADTVFAEALDGRFDAVIAMTHDQGLIPVKTLDMWGGVNTTLGLPIIRTSPDHGTAYDAASAGTCRADSLIAAIELAAQMAHSA